MEGSGGGGTPTRDPLLKSLGKFSKSKSKEHRRMVSSGGRVLVCWAGVKTPARPSTTGLKNLVRSYIDVTKTPFSAQMIASLSGEVKPSVLFILTHHLEGDIKEPIRVGDIGPAVMVYVTCAVIGLGGWGEIKHGSGSIVHLYMLMPDLTSLVPPQFSHWLQVREGGTLVVVVAIFIIIMLLLRTKAQVQE